MDVIDGNWILDECSEWFNLVDCVIKDNMGYYQYIDICGTIDL